MASGNPEARRIIFGTFVVPTHSIEAEETHIRHTEFQTSPAKSLGGKGIVAINKDQWGNGWTSSSTSWSSESDVWEAVNSTWGGELVLPSDNSPIALTTSTDTLAFLYVRNKQLATITGSDGAILISMNGENGEYFLIVPAGGSVHFRGDGNVVLRSIWIKTLGKASIEWIIAKI